MPRSAWPIDDLSLDQPSPARMYDYFLGGSHNFAIDRQAAEAALALNPDTALLLRANRAFLRRAVTLLMQRGIDQFLDLGSGIPTVGNVHEVAQKIDPAARVVYVDSDPLAVAHSRNILQNIPNVAVIQADVRALDAIITHPEVRRVLDFRRPIGVLLVAILHFLVDDAEASRVLDGLCQAIVPGSYVVLSHMTTEDQPPELVEEMRRLYAKSSNPGKGRSRAEIESWLTNLDLVEPGLVYVPLWHPESPRDLFVERPERSVILAAVGRKP